MAHHTEQQGFPAVPLNAGMRVRVRVISPTTGSAVTGVTATEWAIYARDKSPGAPLEDEVPRYTPEEA